MTHEEIEAFLEVCRKRNITRAAETLYISQSSLSIRLKTLEQEIGCRLFVRGKGQRELSLTPEGERFYDLAVQYKDIIKQMENLSGKKAGAPLRVATINSLGSYLFPQVYERFMEVHKEMRLEIQDMETPQACSSLVRGKTDLAFSTSRPDTDLVLAVPVLSEEMVLVCGRTSGYGSRVCRRELLPEQEVYVEWSEAFRSWHEELFSRDGGPAVKLEIMNQLEFFTAKSSRWAIVPYSVACGLLAGGKVRCCGTDLKAPPRVVNCLQRREDAGKEDPAVTALLDCLRETVHSMDPEKIQLLI